ncbi:alpha/beta hydrolase [Psychrobacter sanguinis]|uniref:PGAP1-like alpha/beta domain-containing protein n=1 Tax=Psychrobacter sanguinis TaxID=861445 RepID=UPI001919E5F9|nr:alpha/beta hydrolase [Psychrobacter sanguinis]MCD9150823.1 GPI inositol-deacylase [Psychrobacter sanguinis]
MCRDLNYNTGRRISINGREFAKLLQILVTKHPNITKINLVGHSMGGLVSRSALYYGGETSDSWVSKVDKLITLGTPHHGAVLERIGDIVQQSISKLPFAGSLGKLGDIRSTGIIDLRHGSVRDEDWQSLATRSVLPDSERQVTPLPPHITAYFLAGTLSETEDSSKMSYLLGDGLVNINSALGEHTEMHTLQVPKERKKVFYGVGHFGLLSDKQVLDQAIDWLSDSQ